MVEKNEVTDLSVSIANSDVFKKLDMTLTKSDIINLKVVEVEEALKAERNSLDEQLKKLRKDCESKNKQFDALVETTVESTYGEVVVTLNKCLSSLGLKHTYRLDHGVEINEKKSFVTVRLSTESGYHGESLKDIEFTSELKALKKEIETVNDEISEVVYKQTEIRIKLNDIGSMERRANANVTRQLIQENPSLRGLLPENVK